MWTRSAALDTDVSLCVCVWVDLEYGKQYVDLLILFMRI